MNLSALAVAISTGLGVGYVPVAPGTFGSLLGLAVWALLPTSPLAAGAAIVVVFLVGTWSGGEAERARLATEQAQGATGEILTAWKQWYREARESIAAVAR